MDLERKHCKPCEGGIPPLTRDDAEGMMAEVPGWELVDEEQLYLRRIFMFKGFRESWKFFDRIAALAEEEGHHPDITVRWNRVVLSLTTHVLGGLSENDFILAARINALEEK